MARFLEEHPSFLEQLAAAPTLDPDKPPPKEGINPDAVIEAPHEKMIVPREQEKPWLSRKGRRIDFAERDAANRRLGDLGEEFVVWLEQQWLRERGRDDLVDKVQRVSQTLGDGLGFDVLSFDHTDGSERLIEVKTTALGKFFPFYVTLTEVRCSEDVAERFQLFRVFDFARTPRVYILTGSLRSSCKLDPQLFRATL